MNQGNLLKKTISHTLIHGPPYCDSGVDFNEKLILLWQR